MKYLEGTNVASKAKLVEKKRYQLAFCDSATNQQHSSTFARYLRARSLKKARLAYNHCTKNEVFH